jgi:hypothetical protein
MITFVKKPAPQQSPTEAEANRFEQIRKTAVEQHKKADSDAKHLRAPHTTKGNRLI